MNWYYADQGHRKGPVGEAELDELVTTGALPASALVWCEGMTDWKPYSTCKAPMTFSNRAEPAFAPSQAGHCVCCGRDVLPAESVTIGRNATCPDCKSAYVERLREADLPSLPGGLPYSGFWMRFVARMADYTLLTIAQVVVTGTILTWTLKRRADPSDFFSIWWIASLAGVVLSAGYETAMVATRGATIGKMLCYMRIVHADGSPVGTGAAIGRYFAGLLSRFLTAGGGLAMAAFDVEKRSLHDRIAGTRVIDTPPAAFHKAELEPVDRGIQCEKCQTAIPAEQWNSSVAIPCPGCNTPLLAIVFPAVARTLEVTAPQAKEGEGEAGCYYHDSTRAATTCQECGRFLCPLCGLDAGARHICPNCFNGLLKPGNMPEFAQRRTLYDSIALTAAVLPNLFLITIYLTFLTAPAVVGFSIWSWKKPGSVIHRTSWRFVLAIVVSSVNISFVVAIIVALAANGFR